MFVSSHSVSNQLMGRWEPRPISPGSRWSLSWYLGHLGVCRGSMMEAATDPGCISLMLPPSPPPQKGYTFGQLQIPYSLLPHTPTPWALGRGKQQVKMCCTFLTSCWKSIRVYVTSYFCILFLSRFPLDTTSLFPVAQEFYLLMFS